MYNGKLNIYGLVVSRIEAIAFGIINDTIHSVGERTTVKEVEGLTAVYKDLIKKF